MKRTCGCLPLALFALVTGCALEPGDVVASDRHGITFAPAPPPPTPPSNGDGDGDGDGDEGGIGVDEPMLLCDDPLGCIACDLSLCPLLTPPHLFENQPEWELVRQECLQGLSQLSHQCASMWTIILPLDGARHYHRLVSRHAAAQPATGADPISNP